MSDRLVTEGFATGRQQQVVLPNSTVPAGPPDPYKAALVKRLMGEVQDKLDKQNIKPIKGTIEARAAQDRHEAERLTENVEVIGGNA